MVLPAVGNDEMTGGRVFPVANIGDLPDIAAKSDGAP